MFLACLDTWEALIKEKLPKKKEELSEVAKVVKTQTEPKSNEDHKQENSDPEINSGASWEDILKEGLCS